MIYERLGHFTKAALPAGSPLRLEVHWKGQEYCWATIQSQAHKRRPLAQIGVNRQGRQLEEAPDLDGADVHIVPLGRLPTDVEVSLLVMGPHPLTKPEDWKWGVGLVWWGSSSSGVHVFWQEYPTFRLDFVAQLDKLGAFAQ